MKEDILKIIQHYGPMPQLKYFQSEVFELNEAIINHELKKSVEYEIPLTEIIGTREHITEEIADVLNMLIQFILYYEIPEEDIRKVLEYKVNRQSKRIDNEKTKKQQN